MLTAAQRERCQRIADALDAGDQRPWLRAEASLTPEEKGAMWDMRQEQVTRAAMRQRSDLGAIAAKLPKGPERMDLASTDLDFWSDDPVEPEDDPDDPMPVCGACKGSGKDTAGGRCQICHGRGRVPAEDQEDDDEQNEDDE